MNALHRMCVAPLLVAVSALVGGCSGSSPSTPDSALSPSSGKAVGSVAVAVKFPPLLANRAPTTGTKPGAGNGVPIGALSVKIRVTTAPAVAFNGVDLAQPQIIAAPTGGATSSPVTFTNIPVGNVILNVTAYTDTNAATVPIAIALTPVTITTTGTTPASPVTVTLQSTVVSITVTPPGANGATPVALTLGTPQTFTATVMDGSGNTLTGIGNQLSWSSSNQIFATVSSPTGDSVQLIPQSVTPASPPVVIEVREVNSGVFTDVPITVVAPSSPR